MTIINNKKTAKVTFEEVEIGEVFFDFVTETYYIRIRETWDAYEESYNAVRLNDGELRFFDDFDKVEKVGAELHISNY